MSVAKELLKSFDLTYSEKKLKKLIKKYGLDSIKVKVSWETEKTESHR